MFFISYVYFDVPPKAKVTQKSEIFSEKLTYSHMLSGLMITIALFLLKI
ncbi:hypothetical protein C7377_0796 [Balneicella halophila]|uniref:Uncharacterized protein n=1 Tax=Balneicella halophila TaxID=1537566 RepID=A0A7L4URS3_BALHA|nr:hypothetical protein C7377_0796 [Balneicella halophila]